MVTREAPSKRLWSLCCLCSLVMYASAAAASSDFCVADDDGHGYVMGVGFVPSFLHGGYCSMLWFEGWTLDSPSRYALGCLGLFVLGTCNELMMWIRTKQDRGTRSLVRSMLYGVQMAIAYFMMLVVMLFEPILFGCMIVGLIVGHVAKGKLEARVSDYGEVFDISS
eukprot:NODE_4776_length_763_cov_28.655462_g4428_i0.p1 GENE.NODE_4776_length_763_cov_28.655462_g4428_i0~~NODE_4776_length_763_cov_28.655462_g4428_i0.p1  ORF type:complete len:192 (+),score=36.65 NODE_4776_length_763_cov_28.655462_g4428_i0:77-577(+)